MPYEQIGKNEPVCIADEVPFEIPGNWEWVRLGCLIYNHGQMTPSENFCYIDIGSINNNIQKLSDEENIIIPEKAPSRARKIVKCGDILYSTVRPYLHNMCIINRDFSHTPIASTGFAVMCCPNNYYNEFLFYYLMSPYFDSYANDTDNAKGVAYPAINDQKLYNALIPVPPLNEQKKIIEKFKTILPSVEKYGAKEEVLSQLNVSFPKQLKKSIYCFSFIFRKSIFLSFLLFIKIVNDEPNKPTEATTTALAKPIIATNTSVCHFAIGPIISKSH